MHQDAHFEISKSTIGHFWLTQNVRSKFMATPKRGQNSIWKNRFRITLTKQTQKKVVRSFLMKFRFIGSPLQCNVPGIFFFLNFICFNIREFGEPLNEFDNYLFFMNIYQCSLIPPLTGSWNNLLFPKLFLKLLPCVYIFFSLPTDPLQGWSSQLSLTSSVHNYTKLSIKEETF